MLKVSLHSINEYENGMVEPTINTLIKLTELYNCSFIPYKTSRTRSTS